MFYYGNPFNDSLFDHLRRLDRELEGSYGWPANIRSAVKGSYPPINVGSTAEQIDVYVFLPGVDINALELTLQQNLLTIAGERRLMSEAGASYFRKERYDGSFRRVVTLPEDVDPDRTEARYEDGVLHITLLRRESARVRKISVQG